MHHAVVVPRARTFDVAILVRGNRKVCFVRGGIG
jgi:hypothetical protein